MAKNKVSDWDVVANNNTDLTGTITLGEGMPPSYVNDAIREMMAQIKQWQSGTSSETLNINGELKIEGSSGTNGQVLVSQGSGEAPKWGDAFITGMIMLWSGATDAVPSGWKLCNGSNGTPDLRDKFVVGAGNSYDVNATGGSKDAIVVSHNHSASTSVSGSTASAGNHRHAIKRSNSDSGFGGSVGTDAVGSNYVQSEYAGEHTHAINVTASTTVNSKGSSGNNANLPPYYALAYIMKT